MSLDVSVVVATFDRPARLLAAARALAAQRYPRDRWELIVADDGSPPEVVERIRDGLTALSIQARLLPGARGGVGATRNRGARAARGAVLIFVDDDIVVGPDFVRRHLDVLGSNPGCWVVGRVRQAPEVRRTPFGRFLDDSYERFHREHAHGLTETLGITAQNLAVRTADFHRLGGFDESFVTASAEDAELGMRARASGIRVLYDGANEVVTDDWVRDLRAFCERQRRYSVADVLLWRKYGSASPRARLVQEQQPIRWRSDPWRVVAKKAVKSALATRPGRVGLYSACAVLERLAPDTRWTRRAYDLAVAEAIFRGVREGFRKHGATC